MKQDANSLPGSPTGTPAPSAENPKTPPLKITDRAAAVQFCRGVAEDINGLIQLMTSETELLRESRYRGAAALSNAKSEAVARYVRAIEAIRQNRRALDRFSPAEVQELQRLNSLLKKATEENLPVIAIAREVSTRIVSGVAALAKKQSAGPAVYGANGRSAGAQENRPATLAVNRAL